MSQVTAPRERLRVGKVIETAQDVVYRDFKLLAPIALIYGALPAAALAALPIVGQSNPVTSGLGATAVSMGVTALLQGSVMHAVACNLNHQPRSLSASLRKGLQVFLPLLGLNLLLTVAILAGLLFLIVPGVILACVWAVATPVRVTEGPGVLRAMRRSRELTRGSRWTIFLLFVCYVLAAIVLSLGFGILQLFGEEVTQFVLQPLLGAMNSLLLTVGASALYYELRRNKEGATPESLASIFD